MNKDEKKRNWNLLILISFLIVCFSIALMINEVKEVQDFCNSIDGNYSFENLNYLCNEKKIYKYDDGWDFERNFTLKIP